MKLPSHTTVIAYLALFVALGGSAYAATQLPKNSVGTKQIKPNAVTTAKLKNGAVSGSKIAANTVTGNNVDESTLGRVPSAVSAESANAAGHANTAATAAHATTAADAKALGGISSSGFLRTDAVQHGTAVVNNVFFSQKLIEFPGWFTISTAGDGQPKFKFKIINTSAENWVFVTETTTYNVNAGSETGVEFATEDLIEFFALSADDPNKHALIDCAFSETPFARVSCSARIPPAA